MYISKKDLIEKDNSFNNNYWIYKIDFDKLKNIKESKILNKTNSNKSFIKKFSSEDKIILFSTIKFNKVKKICFLAYTMVDEIESENETFIMKVKGIKYFNEPIPTINLKNKLSFTKNLKKSSNAYTNNYKKISGNDFNLILSNISLTKEFPSYYDNNIIFTTEDFILKTIKSLFFTIKSTTNLKQIEISNFLKLLNKVLIYYNINKSFEEIQEFYARNIWKLNLKHYSSRDSKKFVTLYTKSGKKEDYCYISLE